MRISDFFHPLDIVPDLSSLTKEGALRELTGKLLERYRDLDGEDILRLLLERERLGSTGIGGGIAIPHAKTPRVEKPILVFGRSTTGIAYDALDGKPVSLFFLLVSGSNSLDVYLTLLARICRLAKDRALCGRLLAAEDPADMYACIEEQDSLL
ncbi:MAG: PTS sugar transporter subunit IIA [Geobacteraceae bacterium]|nr:PTS sugar transporter subunit IIA [Geobacteraceae bacterium]